MAASKTAIRASTLLLAVAPLFAVLPSQASTGLTIKQPTKESIQLVSKTPKGAPPNDFSFLSLVSGDGSVVVYSSTATDITRDPQNGTYDVFLWDRASDKTILISKGLSGAAANNASYAEAVTADGDYVLIDSYASNLVPGDTNDNRDVFLYERATGDITLVSVGLDGAPANNGSGGSTISNDGRYVVFDSFATNLVVGDTNRTVDVFLVDRSTGLTTRVSVGPHGEQLSAYNRDATISGNGQFIALVSDARTLVEGDDNDLDDVFVYERTGGAPELVSATPDGTSGSGLSINPTISDDGRYVAFESRASDLVPHDGHSKRNIFVRDRSEQVTSLVSRSSSGREARGRSEQPSISGDGEHVSYTSDAANLVSGTPNTADNIFLFDRGTSVTTLVSHKPNGDPPKQDGEYSSVSDDGAYVSFDHNARSLIEGLTAGPRSVFLYHR